MREDIATYSIQCYIGVMTRTITQAELRNGSAQVMDRLEAGDDFIITRNGRIVGELVPAQRGWNLTATELVQMFRSLPVGDSYLQMRAETDALFGEDRIDEE